MESDESELIDVAPGLWLWQVQYSEWPRGEGWDGKVPCLHSRGIMVPPVDKSCRALIANQQSIR